MLEGIVGNRKLPGYSVELHSHSEEECVAVFIQLNSHTYYIPTAHHKTYPGEILMQAVTEHI